MATIISINTEEEHDAAFERLSAVLGRTDFSDEEVVEYQALAQALQDYQEQHWEARTSPTDPAIYFEVRLDNGFLTLDELLPLFGGMDVFCEFMTRQRGLDDDTIDRLVASLGVSEERMSGEFTEPKGWELIEDCTDGEDWRAELLAYRDAQAAGIHRDIQDVQDRVGDRVLAVG